MRTIIIIPCHNEQDSIIHLYNEIRCKTNYDVIVVNDCSQDNTKQMLTDNNIPFIDLPINLGIGGAVQTGYKYALKLGYDIAVQLDGDGQHNPDNVKSLTESIKTGVADIVVGSRFITRNGFQSSNIRRIGIKFFQLLLKIVTGKNITDATSGFRAANRKVMQLFADSYAVDFPEPESYVIVARNNLSIAEIPVIMRERQSGVSSIKLLSSVYYMIKVTLGILVNKISPRINIEENK